MRTSERETFAPEAEALRKLCDGEGMRKRLNDSKVTRKGNGDVFNSYKTDQFKNWAGFEIRKSRAFKGT